MKNLFPIAVFLFMLAQINAQTSQGEIVKGYILYNGDPFYVSMTKKGKILEFIREAPEVLTRLKEYERIEYENEMAAFDEAYRPNQDILLIGESTQTQFSFIFIPFKATLPDLNVTQLKSLASNYQYGKISSIEIKSYVTEAGKAGLMLAQNRLDACIDLLKIYGVPSSAIYTSFLNEKHYAGPQIKVSAL